eukprot:3946978-Prymnesium_polylepis.1
MRARAQLDVAGRAGECVGAAPAVGGAHSGCSTALVVGQPNVRKGSDEPRPKSHASLPTEIRVPARARARAAGYSRAGGG